MTTDKIINNAGLIPVPYNAKYVNLFLSEDKASLRIEFYDKDNNCVLLNGFNMYDLFNN